MHLNGEHAVIHELDIYGKVGRGSAHDEVIPFSVRNGKLKINGETSEVIDGKVSVEFVKVSCISLATILNPVTAFRQLSGETKN